MLSMHQKLRLSLLALVFVIISALPVFSGSAVVGSVAGSMNATIGGQALLPNTTIFSGDSLQVNDGVAVVAIDNTSRMVFGREGTVSFLRGADEVTVLLSRGNLSMYHPEDGVGLRVKVGEISIVPAQGFKTLGEVAMLGGGVLVTAKEGKLRVEGNGTAQEVAKGKAITIGVKAHRAAKASPAAKPLGGGGDVSTALQVGALGASGAAAVLAGLSISRASDARDAAAAANATAAQALAAANTAATNSSTICNAVVSPSTPCK